MIDISTDKTRLDIAFIHCFLSDESTWAKGIDLPLVQKALDNSLCFGAYEYDRQIGFARVISDYATFAYLCDVFVATSHRGRGTSRLLMDAVIKHPELQSLRRFTLVTSSAHELYKQYGWTPLHAANAHMERFAPDIYIQRDEERFK